MNNSKPCIHCVELIRYYGVGGVYYSYDKGLMYEKGNAITTEHVSAKYINKAKNQEKKRNEQVRNGQVKNKQSNSKKNNKRYKH